MQLVTVVGLPEIVVASVSVFVAKIVDNTGLVKTETTVCCSVCVRVTAFSTVLIIVVGLVAMEMYVVGLT